MTTARPCVRRIVAVATAIMTAALTGAVVPIGTGVAQAAVAPQIQFLALDLVGAPGTPTTPDFYYGLYSRATPDGALTTLVPESQSIDIESVSASRDGSRFADVEVTYDSFGSRARSRVVVRDVGGRTVRVVEDTSALGIAAYNAILSPDGMTVVWNRYESATGTTTLRRAAVSGGASTVITTGMDVYTFLDASTVLANTTNGAWVTQPITGGPSGAITGIPSAAFDPVASLDGSSLVWSLDVSIDLTAASDVQVAPLTSDTSWHVGTPVTIATGTSNTDASFADAFTVMFLKDDGVGGPGETWSAPADGSTPAGTRVGSAIGDVWSQAMGRTDATAPGAAMLLPATLNGTSATLSWTLPTSDLDLSGVVITRTLSGGSPSTVYVPAYVSSRVDTGLVIGNTYSYSITAVDRSGNVGPAATRSLTALLAKPTAADPTSINTTHTPFPVTFGPSAPAGTTFNGAYRSNLHPGYLSWFVGLPGANRVFGSPVSGAAVTTSVPGATYQFRVQGFDAFGNSTPLATSGLAVVPFDHTRGSFVGGTIATTAPAWLGSYRVLTTTAEKVTVSATGNRFQLIGWRCTRCGVFDIFEGATRVGTVDTYATATVPRVAVFTRTWTTAALRTLTIKPRATAGRPSVVIDGFTYRSAL